MNSPSTPPGLPWTELYGDRYFSGPYSTAQFTKEEDDLYERIRANLPAVLAALAMSESRLGQWTPVAVGQLPSGAEDVLTWTITGHCDSAHPHRIRALHAEAQQTGEECFYTHWMPKPGGPK